MPLPASGAISLNDLQTEFGGSNPIAITEYYRGGGLVPDIAANSSVPTSGQISLSNFYNATNADPVPAAFDINNISGNANSNQITITSINTPITLNFGTSTAYANGIDPYPLELEEPGEESISLQLYIYVNGSLANTVSWASPGVGNSGNITLNAKVTVSNNDTLKVGLGVSGGGSGGATFNITNDSSSNTSLDTFDVSS